MEVEYADEALDEGMDAAAWYEARQEQLARRFLLKWKETENRVAADPAINRKFTGEFRRCRFDVFPYALVYRIVGEGSVQIVAVMHQSREPGYWNSRAES